MIKIAPSILSADFSNLQKEVIEVDRAGAEYIHIDVMDGHYVSNITFGPDIVKSLRPLTTKLLDIHLMISPVENFIEKFIKAGANIISFHPEADKNPHNLLSLIKNLNCKAGIAIHPKITVNEIKQYLSLIDIVIVMTVNPGLDGQDFMKNQISKISLLNDLRKKNNLQFEIEVDGGINKNTGKICKDKGADVLVAGSYIFSSSNLKYKYLIDSLR